MTAQSPLLEDAFEGTDLRGIRQALPWRPEPCRFDGPPDAFVEFGCSEKGPARFGSMQAAIDYVLSEAAVTQDAKRRRTIQVGPGVFEGPIVLPKGAPPLAIQGAGAKGTMILAGIDAQMSGQEYATRFNAALHQAGPQAKALLLQIAARQKIGTGNTAVLRICSDDVQIKGLTIRNDYACDRASAAPVGAEPDAEGRYAVGQHQAVALMLDGADRVIVEDCALSSFQDTLYLRSGPSGAARSVFQGCDIEGDVDFIFGGGTAHFEGCILRSRGARGAQSWALAPSTSLYARYGFIFHACYFVHDLSEAGRDKGGFLGRQWFEGVRATPYGTPRIPDYTCVLADVNRLEGSSGRISHTTLESVGKCHLSACHLGGHLDSARLWDDWSGGAWGPRFRPAQSSAQQMLSLLKGWLPAKTAERYAALKGGPWLSIETCGPQADPTV